MSAISDRENEVLLSKKICMIGFGAQGKAESLNLKRSGINLSLGLREGPSFELAEQEGFHPLPFKDALKGARVVVLNLPDQHQAHFYQEFKAELMKVETLVFAHGFNTHFKLIAVESGGPAHLLVAPKGAAHGLQEFYKTPQALPAILAQQIYGRESEKPTLAEDIEWAEAYAKAIGCNPAGLIWARFKDETDCDLFSEQTLLCGGVSSLLRNAFETLVEAGYSPETAYFETLYELKLIVDLIWKQGITGMRSRISPTARYGDITRGDRVIDSSVKDRMKEVLAEVQSGKFAREFLDSIDSEKFKAKENEQKNHPLELLGQKIRTRLGSGV